MDLIYEREKQAHHSIGVLELVPIMEVYQNNPKDFLNLFPGEILGSATKDGAYKVTKSFHALQRYNFIQYNSKERISIICVDIDHHKDGAVWMDHDLPQPSWTIWTDRGIQFMWVLEKPILALISKHKQYAKDVLLKIVYALDADTHAIGFNRVFRNPLTHQSRFSSSRVNLKDFNHLKSPPREWLEKIYPKKSRNKTLWGDHQDEAVDFTSMEKGDGRNEALFDRLRFWAYAEVRTNKYSEFDLTHKAYVLNQAFKEPLKDKEVDTIITSIDGFIENVYMRSNYMATTTKEERSKIASKNGAKGGMKRKQEARTKILTVLNTYTSWEKKITVSGLAKDSRTDAKTVRAYLKEMGYKEVSRSEGWKKQ